MYLKYFVFTLTLTTASRITPTTAKTPGNSTRSWNKTAAFESLWGDNNSYIQTNPSSSSSLLQPKNYKHELPPVPNSQSLEDWIADQFTTLNMDYVKFKQLMDSELNEQQPAGPGRQRQVDKAPWLLELQRTVPEVNLNEELCQVCRAGVGLILHYVRLRRTLDELKTVGYSLCIILKAQTPRVCRDLIDINMDEAVFILKRISLTPENICSFLLDGTCGDFDLPDYKWNVTFPDIQKPPVKPSIPSSTEQSLFKVLHISDIHYDPYYMEGTNADCNEQLCCRGNSGPANTADNSAGMWGDYRQCDTPKKTLQSMLEHISTVHDDIDYILWTGDAYPHNVYNRSKEDTAMVLREIFLMFTKTFPSIPIFPALGNHDTFPADNFPLPIYNKDANITWLYEVIEQQWSQLMLNNSIPTVSRGAFYSMLVRPKFRLIALNTQFCSRRNGWLLLNSTDPGKMLEWLIYELQEAELQGEKVHVIGHIPPGNCMKEWSRNYNDIVVRFESTITAQFFGHTHRDQFQLFYDTEENLRPVGVAYIGPSVTPIGGVNPGYRIYYIEGDQPLTKRSVIDHETWILNLAEANLYKFANWYKLYSARSAYKMSSLEPEDWDDFIIRMAKEEDLFDLFNAYFTRNITVSQDCDIDCKKQRLCDLRSGNSNTRNELCSELNSIIDASSRLQFNSLLLTFSLLISCYIMQINQLDFRRNKS